MEKVDLKSVMINKGLRWTVACIFIVFFGARPGLPLTTPSLTAQPSSPLLVGGSMTDTATLAGGASPTGTITFSLFDSVIGFCQGPPFGPPPVFTSTKTVSGNGSYTSDPFSPLVAQTVADEYIWLVSYSGDVNNNSAAVSCGYGAQTVAIPQNCPSTPPCPVISSGCPGGLKLGNTTFTFSTTSCTGSSPGTNTRTTTVFGPNDICIGPSKSLPCHVVGGDTVINTNTETVFASAVVSAPTLSFWGLGALAVGLLALSLRRLAAPRVYRQRSRRDERDQREYIG